MNDEQIELAIALAIRRNWDDNVCGYVENCSDKDISLFLNVSLETVVKVRLATTGHTRNELEEMIRTEIQEDLSVIKRMLDTSEVAGWIEEARGHLRNMQANLGYADKLIVQILQCAKTGDQKKLIDMFGNELW